MINNIAYINVGLTVLLLLLVSLIEILHSGFYDYVDWVKLFAWVNQATH